jgi:hypothetical protein
MKWSKLHTGLMVCIAGFVLISYVLIKPSVEQYPPFLSFSPDKDGVKAIVELLEQQDHNVKEWKQSWRLLPRHKEQAMLVIQPYSMFSSEQDELLEWAALGNDVFIFQQKPDYWEDISFTQLDELYDGDKPQKISEGSPVDNGIEQYTGKVITNYRLEETADTHVVYEDAHGVLAVQRQVGSGSFTIFLTPEWLINEYILLESHFEMVWPLFQDRQWNVLWVDEYHHGYEQEAGFLQVYPRWLVFFLIYCAALGLLWLWWKGKRFGPTYTPRAYIKRRGDETLLAAAGWLQRDQKTAEMLLYQADYFKQQVSERWGISTSASHIELLKEASHHWRPEQVERLRRLLKTLDGFDSKQRLSDQQLLMMSKEWSKCIRQLEE